MSRLRTELQSELEAVLGSRNVYFQPPESVKMKYPAIIYKLNAVNTKFADDISYSRHKSYRITVVDKNPDTKIPERVMDMLPMCRFDRHYTADGLNHYIFNVYY